MRMTIAMGPAACLILAACGPAIAVQAAGRPALDLSTAQTFRLLPTPAPRDDVALDANNPLLASSITHRELRRHIVAGFIGRGYRVDEERPDFVVAFYASTRRTLDVMSIEGTVIIEVLEPGTLELLWRGRGVVMVSDDVNAYVRDLCATVHAILDKFPLAVTVVARERSTPGRRLAVH